MKQNHLSIWFIIGLQLTINGLLITGAGIYDLYFPPKSQTVLENLHPAIWWGAFMLLLGLFYSLKFRRK
jgi:hypothetical protein